MTTRATTDRNFASSSTEFVWDQGGHTECHGYLLQPVREMLRNHGAVSVLDLGCGNGAVAAQLQQDGYAVTGLDHSGTGIAIAQQSNPGVTFARHDLAEPLPAAHAGRYDAVVTLEVIEHLLLPRKLMDAARTALKPGGLLVLSTPYHGYWKNLALAATGQLNAHWHPLRDYGHIKFFSKATIRELFAELGLEDIRLRTAGRFPPFGCSMIVTGVKT